MLFMLLGIVLFFDGVLLALGNVSLVSGRRAELDDASRLRPCLHLRPLSPLIRSSPRAHGTALRTRQ